MKATVRKQNTSFEMWVLEVNEEELEMIRVSLSTRGLHLEEKALTGYHSKVNRELARKYRNFVRKISEQVRRQTGRTVDDSVVMTCVGGGDANESQA